MNQSERCNRIKELFASPQDIRASNVLIRLARVRLRAALAQ